jgi:hypothetical protein
MRYATSKAVVIALTVQYAKNLPLFRVDASDPGDTATDSNGPGGHQRVTEGTDANGALALMTTVEPSSRRAVEPSSRRVDSTTDTVESTTDDAP